MSFKEAGKPMIATIKAEPSDSELALRLTYQEPAGKPASGMFAWQASKKQIVETWFQGGGHVRICFDGLTEDGALIGPGEGMIEGKQFSDVRVLKFGSRDQYTHARRGIVQEGESQSPNKINATRAAD